MEIDIRWYFPPKPYTLSSSQPWYKQWHRWVILAIGVVMVAAVFIWR